jgi:hypothetical protein
MILSTEGLKQIFNLYQGKVNQKREKICVSVSQKRQEKIRLTTQKKVDTVCNNDKEKG